MISYRFVTLGLAAEAELAWESPLSVQSILKYPHPKLRVPNGRVKDFGEPLQKLADEMFEVMYQLCSNQLRVNCFSLLRKHKVLCICSQNWSFRDEGVGLAAPQIGVNLKLMVFNPEGERGKGEELVLANPKIVSSGKGKDIHEEGCLSFKDKDGAVAGEVEVCAQAL